MKTKHLLAVGILTLLAASSQAQTLYVGGNSTGGTVGKYDAITGVAINASFITGLNQPDSILLSGNTLFAVNEGSGFGTVSTYNATTGAAIHTNLITGLNAPSGVALFGNNLLIAEHGNPGTVSEYNASTGALINSNFVTGLSNPWHLAISGTHLFVADEYNLRVGEYDAITGAAINPNFISGLNHPIGMAISGNTLYVSLINGDAIGKFDATTGAAINANFVSIPHPFGLAVSGNHLYAVSGFNNAVGEYDATTGATINVNLITGGNGASLAISTAASANYNVPLPTSAPTIANLPRVDHFYSDLRLTLQNHSSEFSADSNAFLNSTASSLQPIIDPSSGNFLKNHAAAIADGLSFVSDEVGALQTIVNPGTLAQKAFGLGLGTIGRLLPASQDTLSTYLSTAQLTFDVLGTLETNVNPVQLLISVNTYIYGTLLPGQLRAYGHDPLDPNFQTIYSPIIDTLKNLPTTGNVQLDGALSKAIADSSKASAYLQAVNASFDKYAGAIQAGDGIHATLQMEALLNYLSLYNQAMQDAAADTQATQVLLTSLGLSTGSYDPLQLATLQNGIATNGLPADLVTLLTQLGLTPAQMDDVKQSILGLDPNAYSGTLADANSMAANTLLQGTTAAPEPASATLLGFGTLLLAARRRRVGSADLRSVFPELK